MEDALMIPRESLISQFNCKFVALGQMSWRMGFKGLEALKSSIDPVTSPLIEISW